MAKNNKPILIGLSSSLDSFVAAYLLKIQKENLFAVTLLPTPDHLFGCHLVDEDMRKIKKFCDQLQIPHQVVSLETEFLDQVREPYISAKIEGSLLNPCFSCHQFRLRKLYQHMKSLKLDRLATGHLAKVLSSPGDNKVSVSSSPDYQFDQSHYFISLEAEILSCLELPLSDLQKKDIKTLAENFALNDGNKMKCLSNKTSISQMLKKEIPVHMCKEGEISKELDKKVGRHEGLHLFELGDTYKEEGLGSNPNEIPKLVSKIDFQSGAIQLEDASYFQCSKILIHHTTFSQKQGISRPFRGYLHLGGGLMDKEVIVYPKTLASAVIVVVGETHSFIPGNYLSIYKRRGKSSPLLAQGRVLMLLKDMSDAHDENQEKETPKIKLEDLHDEYF